MATKYYVTVNKEGVEKETVKYDLITTRKADYTKFAKNELKNGADSVDVHASYTLPIDKGEGFGYIKTFYPEDFNIR